MWVSYTVKKQQIASTTKEIKKSPVENTHKMKVKMQQRHAEMMFLNIVSPSLMASICVSQYNCSWSCRINQTPNNSALLVLLLQGLFFIFHIQLDFLLSSIKQDGKKLYFMTKILIFLRQIMTPHDIKGSWQKHPKLCAKLIALKHCIRW